MMMLKVLIVTIVTFLSFIPVYGQVVVRVLKEYVLIDTDKDIGKLNEKISVYRLSQDGVQEIGAVRILKFDQGKTGAKIISEKPGKRITVGDFVEDKSSRKSTESKSAGEVTESKMKTVNNQVSDKQFDRFGLYVGRYVPSAGLVNQFEKSYSFGFSFKMFRHGGQTFILDAVYPVLHTRSVFSDAAKSSLFFIQFTDHIRIGKQIHYDLSGGVYFYSFDPGNGLDKIGETYFGFSLGFSVDFKGPWGGTVSPMLRYHTYKTDLAWNECVLIGTNFYFSLGI